MPKLKTHRGARKRFKLTAKGKVKRPKAFTSHLKRKKSSKKKRISRRAEILSKGDAKKIKRLLPKI